MTFYEAAVAVLREAGRPLHYKKIAEIAVREGLLSHVGKTPEITMGARLSQEVKKDAADTVLVSERPGIYALRDGADPDEARETIRLRDDVTDDDDDDDDDLNEDGDDNGSEEEEDGDQDDDDSGDGDGDGEDKAREENGDDDQRDRGRRRRRRRGRRGGRTRRDEEGEDDGSDDEDNGDDDDADDDTPPPPRPSAPPATIADDDDAGLRAAGDFARTVVGILTEEGRDELTLRQLSGALNRRGFGAAGKLSPAIVRRSLEESNLRRAQRGWPPLFVETRPDRWALAAASGHDLAASYTSLAEWQVNHRRVLRQTLAERLRNLSGEALASVSTLLLERLGHESLKQHDRMGREHTTISAVLRHGLTGSRVAVRIADPKHTVTREDLVAFRGSLHHYEADDGAFISPAGFDDGARSDAVVPNLARISLVDAFELADHLASCGVGVTAFRVDVSCVDDVFFRDFDGDQ